VPTEAGDAVPALGTVDPCALYPEPPEPPNTGIEVIIFLFGVFNQHLHFLF
jgi:hypothetical protein